MASVQPGRNDVESTAEAVIAFWFGEITPKQRFARDEVIDAEIGRRFGGLLRELSEGVPREWRETPRRLLASVIVLDQFSRNIHRNDPRSFSQDALALELADEARARRFDRDLPPEQLHFLYMPYMHSESPAHQRLCVTLIEGLNMGEALDYALRHKVIIDRFGRFPHRNAVLGRKTSAEEAAFLQEPGSSF